MFALSINVAYQQKMELCNMSKIVHLSSQNARFIRDFISLACKFNALKIKSHSLLDDPRTRYRDIANHTAIH